MLRKQAKDGIRPDKLMYYFNKNKKEDILSEGKSLLDIGFTRDIGRETAQLSQDAGM